jgi:flagellar motor switch protein FliG
VKKKGPVGGVDEVAKMLQHMEEPARSKLLASLAERDPELTGKIRDRMLTFEDLVTVDPRIVQKVLREVPQRMLALAMRGASADLNSFVARNMSQNAAKMLQDEIKAMPPQKVTDVQVAQQQILERLKKTI